MATPTYHKCVECVRIAISRYTKEGKTYHVCGWHQGREDYYEYKRDIENILKRHDLINEDTDSGDLSRVVEEIAKYIQCMLDACRGPYELKVESEKKRKIDE